MARVIDSHREYHLTKGAPKDPTKAAPTEEPAEIHPTEASSVASTEASNVAVIFPTEALDAAIIVQT